MNLKDALLQWWQQSQGTSTLSLIRRAKTLEELMFNTDAVKSYYTIVSQVVGINTQPEKIFLAIYLLSHVKSNVEVGLVKNLTQAEFKEMRLKKLVEINDIDELMPNMRKLIIYLKGNVQVAELIDIVLFWGNNTKRNLVFKFFELNQKGK